MKTFAAMIVLLCSLCSVAMAQQETHGGDGFAMEFLQVYSELRAHFTEQPVYIGNGTSFSVQDLDRIRPLLKVVSLDKVYWNGKEVSARNTPSDYFVELSRTHWKYLNFEQKLSLVLHEVLPIAGWKDDDYLVSTAILKSLNIKPGKPSLQVLVEALFSCNTSVLQSISAGLYQSYIPATRADLLQISIISGCNYFINQSIKFSSLQEVQSTCMPEGSYTPFEAILKSVGNNDSASDVRYQQMMDLVYPQLRNQKLSCDLQDRMITTGTVCEVLKRYESKSSVVIKNALARAQCP